MVKIDGDALKTRITFILFIFSPIKVHVILIYAYYYNDTRLLKGCVIS